MSITSMFNTTATISRCTKGTEDGYGAPALTWATVATVNCRIESGSSQELYGVVTDTTGVYRIFLPFDTELLEKDRIVSGGKTYDVRSVSPNPGGMSSHQEALLEIAK